MKVNDTIRIGRREFTLEAALALLSGAAITVSGCGGGSPVAPPPPTTTVPPAPSGGRTGTVTANHGHTAVISSGELTAGNAISLNIRGNADHPHSVSLTAAEVMAISNNQRVSKTSSNEAAHDHTVTFN